MRTGVVAMAYGSPASLEEVGAYLRDIRAGRPVSDDAVAELRARYEAIGGPSPLNAITAAQVAGVQRALDALEPDRYLVMAGMKHWEPRIAGVVASLVAAGAREIVGVALAPHYSRISIGGYESRAREAVPGGVPFRMVHRWWNEPAFVGYWAEAIRACDPAGARVFFTAHSLPARIVDEGDPYVDELRASAETIAGRVGAHDHEVCFQSASHTGEPWLGPDLTDRVAAFAAEGGTRAIVAPIGFTADHLEILYDVDVEAQAVARATGVELLRPPMPNADAALCAAVAAAVARAASGEAAA